MWSRLSLTRPEQMEEKQPESKAASRGSSGDERHIITLTQIPGAPADDLTGGLGI